MAHVVFELSKPSHNNFFYSFNQQFSTYSNARALSFFFQFELQDYAHACMLTQSASVYALAHVELFNNKYKFNRVQLR